MLALEKEYGARATYYFRWNTIDIPLMHDINEAGGEASYHYEEIATYCYKHKIHAKETMLSHIEDIRDMFIHQIEQFRKKTKQSCITIASHGDFVNAKLHTPNTLIVNDRVRKTCGILREAYDKQHIDVLTCRIADQMEMDNFTNKASSN